jgi:hypothetical protein
MEAGAATPAFSMALKDKYPKTTPNESIAFSYNSSRYYSSANSESCDHRQPRRMTAFPANSAMRQGAKVKNFNAPR